MPIQRRLRSIPCRGWWPRRRWLFCTYRSLDGVLMVVNRRRARYLFLFVVPSPRVGGARHHPGKHISERHDQQNRTRKEYQQIDKQAEYDNPLEGVAVG